MTTPRPTAPDPGDAPGAPDESAKVQVEARGEEKVPDVRSGGHASGAPRSLTEAEAHWQEHESSGAAWDSRESI